MNTASDETLSSNAEKAKGGLVTVAGQGGKLLILLINFVVLGRLLEPADFGLLAMVMAVVGIGELLRDFGLSSAAVRVAHLSRRESTNLFWANTCMGVLFFILTCASSPLIGIMYGDSRLPLLTIVAAFTFVLNGLQTQYQVLLFRTKRYSAIALTEIIANGVSLGVATALALSGAGYWALVAQPLGSALLLLIMRVLSVSWIPAFPYKSTSISHFASFGWRLAAAQIANYISFNAGALLIGVRFDATQVGLYSRSLQITSIPLNQGLSPVTNVVLPGLARAYESGRAAVSLQKIQCAACLPMGILLAVVAASPRDLVGVLLGSKWLDAAPILGALAVGSIFQVFTFSGYWLFLASGETGSLLRYNLVSKSAVLSLLLLGGLAGPTGAAMGYAAGLLLSWPLCSYWTRKLGGVGWTLLRSPTRYVALVFAPIVITGYALAQSPLAPEVDLGLCLLSVPLIILLSCGASPKMRKDFVYLRDICVSVVRRKTEQKSRLSADDGLMQKGGAT